MKKTWGFRSDCKLNTNHPSAGASQHPVTFHPINRQSVEGLALGGRGSAPVLGTSRGYLGRSGSVVSIRLWEGQRQILGFLLAKYNPYWEWIQKPVLRATAARLGWLTMEGRSPGGG